jgi:hypothetical protein
MEGEIRNRVAESNLVTFNLEDFYPEGSRFEFDVTPWLLEGVVLQEKPFREQVDQHDWSIYQDAFVAIKKPEDAIIPAWAFMLIASHLEPYAKKVVLGTLEDLETQMFSDLLYVLNYDRYADKMVIIKGCSKKPVPTNAYIMAMTQLQKVAKSVMFGEACSSVPLYKRR